MLKVGITGGIGSGKSTVARVFAALGIPVYEADERAKVLIEEDPEIVSGIRALFGDEAYRADGKYNKTYVAEKVFRHPGLLQKLNGLVHPAVGKDFEDWAARQHAPYVIKEAAVMNRGAGHRDAGHRDAGLDRIIVVSSPLALRIERIKNRDGRSQEQIENIIRNQKSEEEFQAMADYVIPNNEQEFITEQVLRVDAALRGSALDLG
ncbi:MAG: dephospho-CoA kinase [Leadbetterella sp.]|nr:dephospho-CoA kinase [Leadbetterella sp.]